jgi:outer membrane protein assembly factor BamB
MFLLGNEGLENEFVQALDALNGKRVWSTRLGKVGNPNQNPSYPGARSTPTVDGEVLYALGSDGDLACVETATGKIRWQKNLRSDFGGKPGTWAYSESPLIDGSTLLCTPGGSEATLLALNKATGDLVWRSALSEADEAAYASAIIVEAGGVKQYVQLLQKGLVGVDARNGKLLWRYDKAVSKYGANIPTPLNSDGTVFCGVAGTGAGAVRLNAVAGNIQPEELYFESKLPTAIGGVVKVGGYLYGTTATTMLCSEFATGKIQWEERGLGAAALCYADGRLYLQAENGEVGLIEPSPEGYRENGRFSPPNRPARANQMEKAWVYPVVANGRLYLRDHATLWCYDVKG